MSRSRTLDFDGLEPRKLLATAHHAAAHIVHPAQVAAPLVLNGNLALDNDKASTQGYSDESTSTDTPVGGTLGSMGTVTGVWIESHDSSGDITGLDTIHLHNASGTVMIAFNDANAGKAHKLPNGDYQYSLRQAVVSDTGIYAGATEKGTIVFTVNHAGTLYLNMALTTTQS